MAVLLRDERDLTGVGVTREGKGKAAKLNPAAAPGGGVVIPDEMDGVPVRVEVTGRIKARSR